MTNSLNWTRLLIPLLLEKDGRALIEELRRNADDLRDKSPRISAQIEDEPLCAASRMVSRALRTF